jgi:hypothetical protein
MSTETQAAPEAQSDKKSKTVTITYNGQPLQIEAGNYSVEKLRKVLQVPEDDLLAQLLGDVYKELTGHIDITGGEVLAAVIKITYNGNPFLIRPATYTVQELRQILKVPTNDILAEFIDGSFKDLTQGNVKVVGKEIFASHVPQGGAAHAG